MSHRWLVESGDDVLIFIHMLPNSSKKSIFGVDKWRDRLKVSVLSPPISGQANMELVGLISSWASVKKKNVVIEKGHKTQQKTVRIKNIKYEHIFQLIGE